jgi:hypothetical protein
MDFHSRELRKRMGHLHSATVMGKYSSQEKKASLCRAFQYQPSSYTRVFQAHQQCSIQGCLQI